MQYGVCYCFFNGIQSCIAFHWPEMVLLKWPLREGVYFKDSIKQQIRYIRVKAPTKTKLSQLADTIAQHSSKPTYLFLAIQ